MVKKSTIKVKLISFICFLWPRVLFKNFESSQYTPKVKMNLI
jgi:hypothetical protein